MADLPEVPAGANMEDCPRCPDRNPDYPFICPGHPAATVTEDDERRFKELKSAAAAAIREAETRAEQAEDLLRVAHETSNRSEAERARAVQRAEAMERAVQSTAAAALKHSGCHAKLVAQCIRAEQAEARAAVCRADAEHNAARAERAEALLEKVRVYAQYHATLCEGYCCDYAPKLVAMLGEPETQLCELPHATIEEEDACGRERLARMQTPQEGTT